MTGEALTAATIQTLPELHIVAYPSMAVLPIGTRVRFEAHTKDGSPLSHTLVFMWQCINDPASIANKIPSRVRGPSGHTWDKAHTWDNARWSVAGRHTILLTVQNPATGETRRIEMAQRVDNAAHILHTELGEAVDDSNISPFQYLLQIEQYRKVLIDIAAVKPPSARQAEAHLNRVAELDDLIARLQELTQGLANKEGYPVRALHIDEETGTRTPLRLWLCNVTGRDPRRIIWRLIDWTSPTYRQATGEYEARSDEDSTAIKQVFAHWNSGNRYPKGRLHYQVDLPRRQLSLDDGFATDGRSFWDSVSNWLGYTALAAGLIALAVAPIPGSRIAAAAIYMSIATSSGSAVINIASRHNDGFGNGRDDLFDGLTLVGNLFAVGAMWRMGATLTSSTRLGSGMTQATLIGQISADGLQAILLGAECVPQYIDIMESSQLSPEDRLKQILALLSSAVVTGALTYISVQGTLRDMRQLNNISGRDLLSPDTRIDLDVITPIGTPITANQNNIQVTLDYQNRYPANQGPARQLVEGLPARLRRRYKNPRNFQEARDLLGEARIRLQNGGSPLKYSDNELHEIVAHAHTLNDHYTVRFMEKAHVKGNAGDEQNSLGNLGRPDPTTNHVKYWSTTFDQVVDSDSDPDLIRRTLGISDTYFKPDKEYVMVLIDQRQYRALGTETFVPTYSNMAGYVIRSTSPDPEDARLIRRVMSDEYNIGPRANPEKHSYRALMDEVEKRKIDLKDNNERRNFLSSKFGDDAVEKRLFKTRYQLELDYGIQPVFTGNGLTKNLHPGNQEYAALETFTVEAKPNVLQNMMDDGIIDIIDLTPLTRKSQ